MVYNREITVHKDKYQDLVDDLVGNSGTTYTIIGDLTNYRDDDTGRSVTLTIVFECAPYFRNTVNDIIDKYI